MAKKKTVEKVVEKAVKKAAKAVEEASYFITKDLGVVEKLQESVPIKRISIIDSDTSEKEYVFDCTPLVAEEILREGK